MFRRLSISSFRFFLAGKGLSFRTTGKYLGEALLVGLVTGFVVVAFRWMLGLGFRFILQGLGHHHVMSSLPSGPAFAPGRIQPDSSVFGAGSAARSADADSRTDRAISTRIMIWRFLTLSAVNS